MKNLVYLSVLAGFFLFSCASQQNKMASNVQDKKEEPVRIANDSLEYEILIIDIGFNNYLNTIAQPMGYYTQEFLETRNIVYVTEWNNRVRNATQYDPTIYENIIDYQAHIDYGMEVNYKLFNYFQFAQRKYNMRLAGFRVR